MSNEEIAQLNFSGWPLPDEFLTEIGRVAALWACLESLLDHCLAKLAGFDDLHDHKPLIFFTHLSFPQRLDMLAALCEDMQANFPQLAGYKEVVSKLKAAQLTRNSIMHHGFTYDAQNHCLRMPIASARGKLKTEVKLWSLEDIKRASIDITDANRPLYKLVFRREIPPPWHRPSA